MIIHIRKTMGLSNGLAAAYKVEKKRLKVRKKKKEREIDMTGQEDNVLQTFLLSRTQRAKCKERGWGERERNEKKKRLIYSCSSCAVLLFKERSVRRNGR